MRQVQTTGIVLRRTDFGEADRILTVLTPDYGKVSLLAKGVRKSTSKLAGGIELFSVSHISLILGKGEVSTLISTRLINHFGNIVKNIDRTMLGYELLKRLNRATEDATGPEYFSLLETTLAALNNAAIHTELVEVWFDAQLLKLAGHSPNLTTNFQGQSLESTEHYSFDFEKMVFAASLQGIYTANHIKFLRLAFGAKAPESLAKIANAQTVITACQHLVGSMRQTFIRM